MAKLLTSVALTCFMFVLPLFGKWTLWYQPHLLFFSVASMWSLLTQPAIDLNKIKAQKQQDHYTTLYIMGAIVFSQAMAVGEWAHFQTQHHFRWNYLTVSGMVAILFGSLLRYWAIRTLGRFFTASVSTADTQPIIADGPYRYLRHPSYTGGLLGVVGMPLVLETTYAPLVTFALLTCVYAYRIKAEEQALLVRFGEAYRHYQTTTWRMWPWLW